MIEATIFITGFVLGRLIGLERMRLWRDRARRNSKLIDVADERSLEYSRVTNDKVDAIQELQDTVRDLKRAVAQQEDLTRRAVEAAEDLQRRNADLRARLEETHAS